jgi:hypothetical protein
VRIALASGEEIENDSADKQPDREMDEHNMLRVPFKKNRPPVERIDHIHA